MSGVRQKTRGLGALLALGTVGAVPTVVAFSDAKVLPPTSWSAIDAGIGCRADGEAPPRCAAVHVGPWSLSRALEELLGRQEQQPDAVGPAEGGALRGQSSVAAAAGLPPDQPREREQDGEQGRRRVTFRREHDVSPCHLAARHPADMAAMRRLAAAELARLHVAQAAAADGATAMQPQAACALPPRFDDVELMRYAVMQGLLHASTDAERQRAVQEGAAAAARTAAWLADHAFAPDEELARFAHLVAWQGGDTAGRPILRIAIGRAVSECRGAAALALANAIVTQVELGVRALERAADAPLGAAGSSSGQARHPAAGAAGQVIVVLDCSGASALNAARIFSVFKAVASNLNQHYPGRLQELVLLDVPVVLGWMVAAIKQLVHPATRHKFRVAHTQPAASPQ